MSLVLRPMTTDEISRYVAMGLDAYVAHYAASSGESEEEVRRRVEQQYATYFPDGHPAPGHHLMVLESDGNTVGQAWTGPHPQRPEDATAAWLYDIEIHVHFRGHGYGRRCLELVEARLAEQGIVELGLNVFGGNDTARHLYASAGYREVAISMSKTLNLPG